MDGFLSIETDGFGGVKSWKTKWFVLMGTQLKYCRNGTVHCVEVLSVKDRSIVRPRSFVIDDGASQCWFLCAPDQESHRAWIAKHPPPASAPPKKHAGGSRISGSIQYAPQEAGSPQGPRPPGQLKGSNYGAWEQTHRRRPGKNNQRDHSRRTARQ